MLDKHSFYMLGEEVTQKSVKLQVCSSSLTYSSPSFCLTGFYFSEKMEGIFAYESSEIDWCEDNYRHSEHVVEYFNTVRSTSIYSRIYVSTSFRKHLCQQNNIYNQSGSCHIFPLWLRNTRLTEKRTVGWLINFPDFPLQISSFSFFIISPIMLYLLHPYAKERNLAIHTVWVMMIFVGQSLFVFHICICLFIIDTWLDIIFLLSSSQE